MRIAILTFHRAFNCGALLQAWALKTFLERKGHVVEFPRCNYVGDIPRWRFTPFAWGERRAVRTFLREVCVNLLSIGSEDVSRHGFRRFRRCHLPEADCSPDEFRGRYDVVIVGSDQVWAQRLTGGFARLFFAEGTNSDVPYIAYAASAGDDRPTGDERDRLCEAVGRFVAVSTRERALADVVGGAVACDPTFLLSAADYGSIAQSPRAQSPFLYSYTARPSPFLLRTVAAAAQDMSLGPVITPIGQFSRFRAPRGLTYAVSPGRMVGYQRAASAVVTDSFHGTALAIIHRKPFVSLQGTGNKETRIGDLLERLGLLDRLVTPETPRDVIARRLAEPLPDFSIRRLDEFVLQSGNWLLEAIARAGGRNACS